MDFNFDNIVNYILIEFKTSQIINPYFNLIKKSNLILCEEN